MGSKTSVDVTYQRLLDLGFKPWMTLQELSDILNISTTSLYTSVKRMVGKGGYESGVKFEDVDINGRIYNVRHVSLMVASIITIRQSSFSNEVRGFHPLVETELLNRYADVKHHVPCDAGIIDFVCPTDEIDILIECKVEPFKVSHLRQINKYLKSWRKDIGDCLGVLVYPEHLRDQTDMHTITQSGLDVMFVTIPEGYIVTLRRRGVEIQSAVLAFYAALMMKDIQEKKERGLIKDGKISLDDLFS